MSNKNLILNIKQTIFELNQRIDNTEDEEEKNQLRKSVEFYKKFLKDLEEFNRNDKLLFFSLTCIFIAIILVIILMIKI